MVLLLRLDVCLTAFCIHGIELFYNYVSHINVKLPSATDFSFIVYFSDELQIRVFQILRHPFVDPFVEFGTKVVLPVSSFAFDLRNNQSTVR